MLRDARFIIVRPLYRLYILPLLFLSFSAESTGRAFGQGFSPLEAESFIAFAQPEELVNFSYLFLQNKKIVGHLRRGYPCPWMRQSAKRFKRDTTRH